MENRQVKSQSNRNGVLRDANMLQIAKLEKNIDSIFKRNTKKYQNILEYQSNYIVELYEPNQKLKTQKAFKKQLLLRQLDKLMDQQAIFDKKLTQIKFMKQQETQRIEEILHTQMNPYRLLRTIWSKHQKNSLECKDSLQKIQSLNFTVGALKNAVLSMKKTQQELNHNSECVNTQKQKYKYQKLLKNYERTLMNNQQLRQQLLRLELKLKYQQKINQQLNQKMLQKEKEIRHIKKSKQMQQIDQKLTLTQLKQQLLIKQKQIDKIIKWRNKIQKNTFQHQSKDFKIYFDFINLNISQFSINSIITKNFQDIIHFLTHQQNSLSLSKSQISLNNPQAIINNLQNQENSQIAFIPSLNLNQNTANSFNSMRKKMYTDRPLKARNFQVQKYLGSKLHNINDNKLISQINEQNMKKFVRKSSVLGTSRKLQYHHSQRFIEPFKLQ